MALWFGKKDKNVPEVAAPVAKTQPTPPKIQQPPGSGGFPAVKPPQPTGLMPATPMPAGAATTQPMIMPRTGSTGLKPVRPGVGGPTRSTQRIVLPTPPGARGPANTTKPLGSVAPSGRINLPIGMILRCLPPEVLAEDISKFEANGTAATEIGLPMNMILGQLPSGKVEMALQDLIPHFPPGYLQPTEAIASYLPSIISLPLMDVVMRIPPDLLALRPDQKDVDAAVINMADPFTEEILREQAEAARKQAAAQTNIIEESQAPQEEFVPQAMAATAKMIAPPRRPPSEPLSQPAAKIAVATPPPPMPPVTKLPTPPVLGGLRPPAAATPPPAPSLPTPTRSATSALPLPPRPTTVLPTRPPAPVTMKFDTPPATASSPPVPPVPRNTGSIPAPPPPKHTTSVQLPRRTGLIAPALAQGVPPQPVAVPRPLPVVPPPAPVAPTPDPTPEAIAPATSPDDLQRLAALAMAQLGDSTETEDISAPAEQPAPEPEPTTAVAPEPEPPVEEPAPVLPEPEPFVATAPEPEPMPAPQAVAPAPAPAASGSMAFNLNTCSAEDLVKNIPGCSAELADSILAHRAKIGSFKKLEDLLDVPGITKAIYTNLTGEAPPENRIPLSLNELLGFPADQNTSLKDVTDRIACWPDITGCVLSQSSGLSLVGTVPPNVNKAAIVAFAPRMFDAINKSFTEVSGQDTDALVIPSAGTSFHLFRNKDLYLIIMSRLPQMPERHVKVARFVLAALSIRKD